ncbi:MAG: hypothetical protein VB050_13985 [Geobacteraceae bacterium]|nr:hypothetical protein [Geobacteraceae bacterium]
MKMFLNPGAVSFLCTVFLDPLWVAGIGLPIHWFRDIAMAAAAIVCLYLLVRFRNVL